MPEARPDAQAARDASIRRYDDPEGHAWHVIERQGTDPDGRGEISLLFWSDEVVRRVRAVPANWSSLSVPALIELSWGT